MEVHEAQKLNDLRKLMLENEANGKPPHHGIEEDELIEALSILRNDRRNAAAGSKPKAPKVVLDPMSLFEDKKDAAEVEVTPEAALQEYNEKEVAVENKMESFGEPDADKA